MPPNPSEPELLLVGGRIHALGDHPPAEALLVRAGRVAALGSEAEVRAAASPGARVEQLNGATVTPGLVDAHIHPTSWALARRRVDLHSAPSLEAGLERIAAGAANSEGPWVLGQGWDAHRWGALPTREPLDRVLPNRPAALESHDLHALWLNSAALRRAGIDRETPDPPGGRIVRDPESGEPTGVLLENARHLVLSHIPEAGPEETEDALLDAQRELHRWGITGVHSVEYSGLADFEALHQDERLRLRVLQAVALDYLDAAIEAGVRSGFGGEWLRIGGVKMFLDGALGSRTAWLCEPYEREREYRGISTLEPDDFRHHARRAAQAGIATTVHAIGDAAVGLALDVLSAVDPPAAMPHRIEHLQLCPPEWWERAARSGITASMQPIHLRSDIPAAERHWGHNRSRGAYAFAALLGRGMTLAFGSDAPVETPDPREGLFAAIRRVPRGAVADAAEWYPEHRLSAAQALRAYTEGPARAAGLEARQGRLLPGYDADLAAWDRDPLAVAPDELREMRCVLTMVGGEIVHRAGESG